MTSRFLSLLVIYLLLSGSLVAGPFDDDKTVICFVGHKTSHGFGKHEYMAGCRLIEKWLAEAYPDANVEGRYAVPWPENESDFYRDADAVVFFCSGGGGHVVNRHVPEFDKVMRTGAGLACLHYAVEVPIGPSAKGMLAWMGGYFEKHWSVNPHWIAEFKTFPTGHPAARGIKPFKADDEWYFHMRFQSDMKGVTPILSAVAPKETMKRPDGPHSGNPTVREAVAAGEPQHVAWAYQRGENYNHGRGYGFTGLHYHWNWHDDNFRKTVLNGVAWTARLAIPEEGVASQTPSEEFLTENAARWGGDQNRKKNQPAARNQPTVNPDAKPLFASEVIRNGNPASHSVDIDVPLPKEARNLYLVVDDAGNKSFDWANWAEPRLILAGGKEQRLTELDWTRAEAGHGSVRKNLNSGGQPMQVIGRQIEYGIGTHAPSLIAFALPEGATAFRARGVLDDGGTYQKNGTAEASVKFLVYTENPGLPKTGAVSPTTERTPEHAIASLDVHPSLTAQLFASEPMITSPSSIDIDWKGRVWVCDVVNYRRNQGKREGGDKILILEDTDGDGQADKSTVFYQGNDVDSAHGICVLGDRVIISAGEEIFSLYDRDGDSKADPGSKQIMFQKIGGKQHDHGIHAVHFGPDGKLYFNYGNAGRQLCDPEGNVITDINGVPCTSSERPHQQGMVFRCDLDGTNVELLGWNFRNNWEACVDSFGNIWQSDNDDDGNKGVRINYVMEYGNYGYRDEITGAGWRDPRPGMSEAIPERHWHLNDPGVVPNLLQTGAGSPTGICVYEGTLLPKIFQGQVIHCDAGPNVVRAYPVKTDGGGFSAEMIDILKGTRDNWFRPSDVCVAPDGSMFVADWYDPGVGGHGMRDIERGRIYRLIPKKGRGRYSITYPNLDTNEGAFAALTSPNMATRFLGWMAYEDRPDLVPEHDKGPLSHRARALFRLQARNHDLELVKDPAWHGEREKLQLAALRAVRSTHNGKRILDAIETLADHSSARIRSACAVALRYFENERSNQLWAKLARQYQGEDRWHLEALGIGADLHWDSRMAALGETGIHPELLWRSRATDSADRIAALLIDDKVPAAQFFRALHFQPETQQNQAYESIFREAKTEPALMAAGQLGRQKLEEMKGGSQRLDQLLAPIRGTAEFVILAEKLGLRGFDAELIDYIASHPGSPESVQAARILVQNGGNAHAILDEADDLNRASAVAIAIGRTNDRAATSILRNALLSGKASPPLKKVLVDAMATGSHGSRELIQLAGQGKLVPALKDAAALALARSPDARIRNQAARELPVPQALGTDQFPPLPELIAQTGNARQGKEVFVQATCATCHKVNGEGIDFGPDLSEIGSKLSREGLFQAILYPSAAISHGYHGVTLTTKDNTSFTGFSTGETDLEIQLRLPGGVQQNIRKTDIQKRQNLEQSLMPPALAAIVGPDALVDLVDYLQILK